ncbi:TPM domain-containing protein [Nonlabens sp. SY33080]|uniref:TPM domain-containing protein n=1 Tax=Nonlabens sp. SY33080 TaxID=2719911 RepID=UPI00142894C8|nr:TPM domain-containing protein [Nonlabens sp. SY33080]
MDNHVEEFLTAQEEKEIIAAIRRAENKTSGEIRVHLESTCENAISRAQEVFHLLKMDNTKEENGVLIYLAVDSHKFSIIGDKGIDNKVPSNLWDQIKDVMASRFRESEFSTGIIKGIELIGKELAQYFPWDVDDTNELSDEISKGTI